MVQKDFGLQHKFSNAGKQKWTNLIIADFRDEISITGISNITYLSPWQAHYIKCGI